MDRAKARVYRLDGDTIEVLFVYDENIGGYFGEYPDFDVTPRVTPNGHIWVNVTKEDCTYSDGEFGDCGSCKHFKSEKQGDLIGICEKNIKDTGKDG
mgnify:CR=1 FL=1